ncbi:MAG: hypothetical protein GY847_20180 [Proteobacteria bacterium]|nr:hypothetical protein [Pseudomonadota bacterium]
MERASETAAAVIAARLGTRLTYSCAARMVAMLAKCVGLSMVESTLPVPALSSSQYAPNGCIPIARYNPL